MNKLINWYGRLNIYYQLAPFLVLYAAICFLFSSDKLFQDEERYLWFAGNLLQGFFSPPMPDINLWSGPGYPALLASFMFLEVPLIGLRLINSALLYFSLLFTFKTLRFYSVKKTALIYTILLGSYFPIFRLLPMAMTECLAWLLISLLTQLAPNSM